MALQATSPGVDTEMLAYARLARARIREVPLDDHPAHGGAGPGALLRNLLGAVRDLVELYRREPGWCRRAERGVSATAPG